MKAIPSFILTLCVFAVPFSHAEGEKPAPEFKETYKVLSIHKTEAVFKAIVEQPCRFRTALCPDRCNHGGKLAQFTITRYLNYNKPGKYGSAKTKKFQTMLKTPDTDQKTIDQINKLEPGTPLKLNWEHRYITRTSSNGSSSKFPRNVITLLKSSKVIPSPTPKSDPNP